MAVHMVALAKLKLLAGGHSSWLLSSSLLCSFVLKLPLAALMPASFSDMALCLRFLLFQLNHIWFHDAPMQRNRRWRRALQLLQDRISINERSRIRSDMETLNAIAMLAL